MTQNTLHYYLCPAFCLIYIYISISSLLCYIAFPLSFPFTLIPPPLQSLFTKPSLVHLFLTDTAQSGVKVLARWWCYNTTVQLENSFAVWDLLSAISHNREEMKPYIRAATVSLITLRWFADWVYVVRLKPLSDGLRNKFRNGLFLHDYSWWW